MKLLIAPILLVLLLFVVTVVIVTRPSAENYHHHPKREDTNLAERINSACKPGYKVVDWTTGDQFDPIPAGTVQVTCAETSGNFDTYVVAVAR